MTSSTLATLTNVALGIFNAWMLVRGKRVVLKVVPYVPLNVKATADPITYQTRVTVTNLSPFPIYVEEVGFAFCGEHKPLKLNPEGQQYPFLVEPRATLTLAAHPDDLVADFAKYPIRHAYARTACGRIRTGTSPSLLDYELVKAKRDGDKMRLRILRRIIAARDIVERWIL